MSKSDTDMGGASRRARRRPHCSVCELPKVICACAEADEYDRANPFAQQDHQP